MPTHSKGEHHRHIRKRIYKKKEPYPNPKKLIRSFDKIMLAVAILVPIANLPQLF